MLRVCRVGMGGAEGACLSLPGPPNCGLSRHGRHWPQSKAAPLGMPGEGKLVRIGLGLGLGAGLG